MFTGYDNPDVKKYVNDLGGRETKVVEECTVLITDKIRRTAKFLCMLAKGMPIVGPEWLVQSKESKTFQGK